MNVYGASRLEMQIFPFDLCPEFVAISYTWNPVPRTDRVQQFHGQPFPNNWVPDGLQQSNVYNRQVHINGGAYVLNLHLVGALWAIKRCISGTSNTPPNEPDTGRLPNPLWIFVDAICIRQDDPADKQVQIGNMHKIFSQAAKVFVWLGQGRYDFSKDNQGNNRGMGQCLPAIPTLIKGTRTLIDRLKVPEHVTRSSMLSISQLKLRDEVLWDCLEKFSSEDIPYWERLWVVQEAVMARDITILCGRYALPWTNYVEFMRLCRIATDLSSQEIVGDHIHRLSSLAANQRLHVIDRLRELQPHGITTKVADDNVRDTETLTLLLFDTI